MRCIDADALINELNNSHYPGAPYIDAGISIAIGKVCEAPTVEPERKTGKWEITKAYPHNVYCSECHKRYAQTHWEVWEDGSLPRKYCPNCGVKMEGEDDGTD